MTKSFIRHIAALVLFALCCGCAHLLADGLGAGHHHHCNPGGQMSVADNGGRHQTGGHWSSHDPDAPCGECICHCHFSLCNALGPKTVIIAVCQDHLVFPDAANETFRGETVAPLRLPPRIRWTA